MAIGHVLDALLFDGRIGEAKRQQQQLEMQRQAERELADFVAQRMAPSPDLADVPMKPRAPSPDPLSLAPEQSRPASLDMDLSRIPMLAGSSQPLSLREMVPMLLKARMAGAKNVGDIEGLIKDTQPDYDYVNGLRVDKRSGDGPGFIPSTDKGQEPVFDANGRIVGVRNMDGSIQAAADMAGAVSRAQEGAKADLDLVDVPMRDGTTQKMPRSVAVRMLGGAGGQGGPPARPAAAPEGFGERPSEATVAGDKAASEAAAKAEIDRLNDAQTVVANDQKVLPLLDDMEKLVKSGNLITGFGSGVRLQVDRAKALAGDKDAAKRVTTTEQFQNLTSRQVLPLVKQLGSGNGITDADRKFTQAIVAGDIDLNEETIKRVIEIGRRQAAANAARLNQLKGRGRNASAAKPALSAYEAEMRRRGLMQ